MNRALASAIHLVVLGASASGQSFNLDLGDPASAHGLPSSTYGAAGRPGTWVGIDATPAANLVDIFGSTTGVTLSMSEAPITSDCRHPGTSGGDDALLDDELSFSGLDLSVTLHDLEPGRYRVHLYGVEAPGCPPWDQNGLFASIAGATARLDGAWGGALVEGESYLVLDAALTNGGDLELHLFGPTTCCLPRLSGLQVERRADLASYCFGDGSGAPCPCANPGTPGRGCANSGGDGAWLEASGTTGVALDDLRFIGHGLLPDQPALLFVGSNALGGGAGLSFGDGLRCAGGDVLRLGAELPNANGFALWGPGLGPRGGWSAGDTRRFQAWYRDPIGSPCATGFNSSQAVEAFFLP